jgi:hypothetical protein
MHKKEQLKHKQRTQPKTNNILKTNQIKYLVHIQKKMACHLQENLRKFNKVKASAFFYQINCQLNLDRQLSFYF